MTAPDAKRRGRKGYIPVPGYPPGMIAERLALGRTVCAGCNARINGKRMIPDAVQYRWEGRDYDPYCLSNALGQRVSDAGKWVQVALVAVPATGGVAVAELWESARAAAGNTPDGFAWGYNRRQFVALARELNRMGRQRVIRAGPERKPQPGWLGLPAGHRRGA